MGLISSMIVNDRKNPISAALVIAAGIILACAGASPHARKEAPLMRGLYIPNNHAQNLAYLRALAPRARARGVNQLVMDVHPFGSAAPRINPEALAFCRGAGFYLTARVVCFQDGLGRLPVDEAVLSRLFRLIEAAVDAGFAEVQLDYIRFQDGGPAYPLAVKYDFIAGLLRRARTLTAAKGVLLSADIFGRVVYHDHDIIGQRTELFAQFTDVIYPMLYPSHFHGDARRLGDPGGTVREGTLLGIGRVKGTTARIQPYIQCFGYNIQWARMDLVRYVTEQIQAIESTPARGWVAWNAKGDYEALFKALE